MENNSEVSRSTELNKKNGGLKFARVFTREGRHPFEEIEWALRSSKITNPDGSVVSSMDNVEVPASWSQLATDVAVSKFFRKAGVAQKSGDLDHEHSVTQLIERITSSIRKAGEILGGYFKTTKDAVIFEQELAHLLVHQKGAFNSPVWFNCGLFEAYGIVGQGGSYFWNPQTNEIERTATAYQHPQCSACFIQSVDDDLMSIFDLIKNEARLFKYGSGTGTNFSKLRGKQERLSGGGLSSGLISFLEVLDRGAGATKSGGTTRRAAKMVCLDMDHPEIVDFIEWKAREEKKAKALIEAGYSADFNGEAYRTIAGQNSNNSVRVSDEFMNAVVKDGDYSTRLRTSGQIFETYKAKDLLRKLSQAAWECADPGVQYDTTINRWHTCKETDSIHASNPCSEYMFLDDSACNLASLNLVKFWNEKSGFDVEAFRHAVRIFTTAQEILVDYSSYPTEKIARNSHEFRPLGLGYANLGTLVMLQGLPYDSPEANQLCGAITAMMTGHGYRVSAEIASQKGAFKGFAANKASMLEVIRMHRDSATRLSGKMAKLNEAAIEDWDMALSLGEQFGYRNAQLSVLAPTGTIGLLMDCDTTGIEPDFSLVKFKKLSGGGSFKIVNSSVPLALKHLGYSEDQVREITEYIVGRPQLDVGPGFNREVLMQRGLSRRSLDEVESRLSSAFSLRSAFSTHALGDRAREELKVSPEVWSQTDFDVLSYLGFDADLIHQASERICGTMMIEGAPHLKPEHYAVFDCANKCGRGERFIAPLGHVRMMAAAQPFLSGAISKTVNLPHSATVQDIEDVYLQGWKMGLKAIAVYRDGCKASQPLSSKVDSKTKLESVQLPAATHISRRKLPKKRGGFTQEARVAGHKVYLRTGEYPDGSLGEIFIDMHKEGAAFRSMMNCFAIAVSVGLQHGVPLQEFVDKFVYTRFEPQGAVDHPNIKYATSVIDYVFRVLGMEYLGRTDFVQVKPDSETLPVDGLSGAKAIDEVVAPSQDLDGQDTLLRGLMGDAPFCDTCGHTTVRNGTCYKCVNCGNSMGCS